MCLIYFKTIVIKFKNEEFFSPNRDASFRIFLALGCHNRCGFVKFGINFDNPFFVGCTFISICSAFAELLYNPTRIHYAALVTQRPGHTITKQQSETLLISSNHKEDLRRASLCSNTLRSSCSTMSRSYHFERLSLEF